MAINDENLNLNVIKNFWKIQSLKSNNRWTERSFLDFEIQQIRNIFVGVQIRKILDLGSGTGTLSKSLVDDACTLDAVDYQDSYRKFFVDDPRLAFFESDVGNFRSDSLYDLILFFGVTTYLDIESEEKA